MRNNVQKVRKQKRMTQSALARAVGVQVQTIWNIEHAKTTPRFETMHKLADILGVPVEQLFEDEPEEAPFRRIA